ncbi:acyl-CoA dehydrogenase [Oryzibacter oryziterrae]|uniref:acyl-CoA dehydrogenase n=1 Tax=Oryzibacter oryziterrae TaxID=2766474 RepID=UPI001F482932|nr:acyl-CoA dehydrogenase [Oryzibacter oryziterrae]
MVYRAPTSDIAFWLKSVAGMEAELAAGTFGDLDGDLVDAVIGEAGRFATEELAPVNRQGDIEGAQLIDGQVRLPRGWPDLYRRWAEGGWNALTGSPDHGGQGLPTMLYAATLEIWNGANTAFATGTMLTIGAMEALEAHGSDEQKTLYLDKLISGEWTASMNLTESQAGSDLSGMRTRAEPVGDGSYRIFGQKIFITHGDNDCAENIVHLVLARLPDAPAGTRGISLFVVPKRMINEDGSLGALNDVKVVGLEHKLGIHASPTCVMQFGEKTGAIGWLVGEPNRGLAAMFTMMNSARMSVGLQGVGVAERAYQRARDYANERSQGRAAGWSGTGACPIIHHPDVKRMLLTQRGLTDAARAICYSLAHALDLGRVGPEEVRAFYRDRAALLTPVAKAFSTDIAVEVASIGVQVHGGMGFVEETGAAQDYRDARILPIYEGTNGIQAIDLVTRKLTLADGEAFRSYVAELKASVSDGKGVDGPEIRTIAEKVGAALDELTFATNWLMRALSDGRTSDALAGATPYLRLFGLAAGGAYHLKAVLADLAEATTTTEAARRLAVARFYATDTMAVAGGLRLAATAGAAVIDDLNPALLG